MSDGDTKPKELSLNPKSCIESFYWDDKACRVVLVWHDEHRVWLDYDLMQITSKDTGIFALKFKDLEFIDLLE